MGCPWDEATCANAATRCQLACLRYAHEEGCAWAATTCEHAAGGAARRGHLRHARVVAGEEPVMHECDRLDIDSSFCSRIAWGVPSLINLLLLFIVIRG